MEDAPQGLFLLLLRGGYGRFFGGGFRGFGRSFLYLRRLSLLRLFRYRFLIPFLRLLAVLRLLFLLRGLRLLLFLFFGHDKFQTS